jgi:hypothetical protein
MEKQLVSPQNVLKPIYVLKYLYKALGHNQCRRGTLFAIYLHKETHGQAYPSTYLPVLKAL